GYWLVRERGAAADCAFPGICGDLIRRGLFRRSSDNTFGDRAAGVLAAGPSSRKTGSGYGLATRGVRRSRAQPTARLFGFQTVLQFFERLGRTLRGVRATERRERVNACQIVSGRPVLQAQARLEHYSD